MDAIEGEREIVAGCINLESRECGEGEVGWCPGEDDRYGPIERASGIGESLSLVE